MLLFMFPPHLLVGLTLVVTPLVSLMEDQVMSLQSIRVSAAMLNSSSTKVRVDTFLEPSDHHLLGVLSLWYTLLSPR